MTTTTDTMTENGLKQVVLRLAYLNGWAVYHSAQAQNFRAVKGSSKGYPDLTLARDKEVLWIELKTDEGIISGEQYAWSLALPAYHVIRPKDWHSGRVTELLA